MSLAPAIALSHAKGFICGIGVIGGRDADVYQIAAQAKQELVTAGFKGETLEQLLKELFHSGVDDRLTVAMLRSSPTDAYRVLEEAAEFASLAGEIMPAATLENLATTYRLGSESLLLLGLKSARGELITSGPTLHGHYDPAMHANQTRRLRLVEAENYTIKGQQFAMLAEMVGFKGLKGLVQKVFFREATGSRIDEIERQGRLAFDESIRYSACTRMIHSSTTNFGIAAEYAAAEDANNHENVIKHCVRSAQLDAWAAERLGYHTRNPQSGYLYRAEFDPREMINNIMSKFRQSAGRELSYKPFFKV